MIGKREQQRRFKRKLAIGSAMAATAGYLAGVLTAPKSGLETRKDLRAAAERSRVEAEKELKQLHTELGKVIKDAKAGGGKLGAKAQAELNDLVEKAKVTKEKTREVISAVHEGDAEDQDLKRAVRNANLAIKNLRKYLKK